MSSFIIDPSTMHNVIRAICSPMRFSLPGRLVLGFDVDKSESWDAIGRVLYAMNVEAVTSRYKDMKRDEFYNGSDYRFPKIPRMLTLKDKVECYKALQCFLYQCSEGRVPETETFKEIAGFEVQLAQAIVSSLPEYNAAPWG